MSTNDQCSQFHDRTEDQDATRSVWTAPTVTHLATSEAEFSTGGTTDTEGFTS